MVKAILFDFGGVLAEEGFREGLKAIAERNLLDPDVFYGTADRLIYETGYLTGKSGERDFWNALREKTGIRGTDEELRQEILSRFVVRSPMLHLVDSLRAHGFLTVMLSDQTNWLEEIDRRLSLFARFDRVFNSIRTNMSKRDESTFVNVCRMLAVAPAEALFIDDNHGHVARAAHAGLKTILFTNVDDCKTRIQAFTGRL